LIATIIDGIPNGMTLALILCENKIDDITKGNQNLKDREIPSKGIDILNIAKEFNH